MAVGGGGKMDFPGIRCALKPLVKISKAGSHLSMDDCPINWNIPY